MWSLWPGSDSEAGEVSVESGETAKQDPQLKYVPIQQPCSLHSPLLTDGYELEASMWSGGRAS